MKAILGRLTVAAIVLPLLAAHSGAAFGAEGLPTLRYGSDDLQNINRLPQVIAEREGFFERAGINLEIVQLTSSFRATAGGQGISPLTERQAMAEGAIHMSRAQLPLLMSDLISGTVDYVGVGIATSNPVYFLVVRPEVTTYADLRGKVIAVTGPHDGITLLARELIEQNGVPNGQFETIRIAGSGARVDCLRSGECAGAALAQQAAFELLESGYHSLGITNEIAPVLYQFDVVLPSWATGNRDLIVRYLRATTAAKRFILDPANRETVIEVAADYMGETEDHTRQMLAYFWDPQNRVIEPQASFDMDNVGATVALFAKYGIVGEPLPPPERFVDPSYTEEADRQGVP
jgi:ABC-type nitrate/sulfonate/bicarbonate transport system substrate-binding protein